MRKLAIASLILMSCQSDVSTDEKKAEKRFEEIIETYLKAEIREAKDDIIIDSIQILRVDTLTELQDSLFAFEQWSRLIKSQLKLAESMTESGKLTGRQARLAKEIDADLSEMHKADADDYFKKAKESLEFSKKISRKMDNIERLALEGKLDTITQTGFSVLFNIKATDSKFTVQDIDSATLIFDINRRIKVNPLADF